jgi:competence protein ComEC
LLALLTAVALGWGLTGSRAVWFAAQGLAPALEGRDVLVTGVVSDMPQATDAGLRFRLQVEDAVTVDGAGARGGLPVALPPLLEVGWYHTGWNAATQLPELQRPPADLAAGQRWHMVLRLKAPHGNFNPHGFDYELYLWTQGVQATGYVRATASTPVPRLLAQTYQAPVAQLRQAVRERIQARVSDPRAAGLLTALVVGDQRAIERSDWDVFRATGISHLVSISGLHITMFAWAATWCVRRAWRSSALLCRRYPASQAAWILGLLAATAYAVFSGWGVPAQRTCLMLALVVALRLQGVQWPWPWVALAAAVGVLLWDPWALLQPGFWLSFVAVMLLFAAGNAPEKIAESPTDTLASGQNGTQLEAGPLRGTVRRYAARLLHSAGSLLREQWVITLALAPLVVLWFGQVSLIGLLANAVAIPWVTLVVTPLGLLGVLWPPLWTAATGAIVLLYAAMDALALLPFAALHLPLPPLLPGVLAALGAGLAMLPVQGYLRALGWVPVLALLLWRPAQPAAGEFELLAADVGQGNAVLVQTAGHALLFDTGPRYSPESDAGSRVLLPLIKALDVRLDTVLLSHRDMDHVGGAPAVLMMQPDASLLSSLEPQHALQQLRTSHRCEAGMRWQWDGVDFEVLHPTADAYAADPPPRANALSCVLRVSNGRQAVLLTGDIEAAQEQSLLADPARAPLLRADVLLVPHHGSKTSSTPEFLQAVQPRHALVQAGYRNRYGHPAAEVQARYADLRINLVTSPRCGAARWRSVEPQNVACLREDERKYWHHHVP